MHKTIFNETDFQEIKSRGIDPDEILRQIDIFKKGLPYIILLRPCIIGDGIKRPDQKEISRLDKVYTKAKSEGRTMKFVPASGSATRMFKELTSVKSRINNMDKPSIPDGLKNDDDFRYFLNYIQNIKRFPFYNDLKTVLSRDGADIEKAVSGKKYKDILEYTLDEKGLNLSDLPKALIPFHQYRDGSRTPIEEHLVEALAYTADVHGKARVHFTVSTEHEEAITAHVNRVKGRYEESGLNLEITFSNQKPSTDTIAVDKDNNPFREEDGSLLFRPGGHGALLENLRDLNGDIIFIKNIDNIAPDRLKHASYVYKKALAGHLVDLQDRIFAYLKRIEKGDHDEALLNEAFDFIEKDLSKPMPDGMKGRPRDRKIDYILKILNRPLRVCGIVRNQAEPGGGPFWVRHTDGSVSIQIVEKSQINTADEEQRRIMDASTHFNPVDLVCGVRDYKGNSFDLKRYVDPETCFISVKSYEGRELKALELPGLWNGAMARWNTVFIEVPLITFNPVKTIFDLLRDEHQPEAR